MVPTQDGALRVTLTTDVWVKTFLCSMYMLKVPMTGAIGSQNEHSTPVTHVNDSCKLVSM